MTDYIRNRSIVDAERTNSLKNGWLPLPIKNAVVGDTTTGKVPFGQGWQNIARQAAPIRFHGAATNTGILCDGLFVCDIDLNDSRADAPSLSQELERMSGEILGKQTIIRRRENSSRFLTIFRVAIGERVQKKIKVENSTTGHAIEILATGQQFHAFGFHSLHGVELQWDDNLSPANVNVLELPEVSENQIFQFMDACKALLGAEYTSLRARKALNEPTRPNTNNYDGAGVGPAGRHSSYGSDKPSLKDLEDWLDKLDGESDYIEWTKVLGAVFNTTDGSNEGFILADTWSAKASNYSAQGVFEKWNAHAQNPMDVGGYYILNQVRKQQAERIAEWERGGKKGEAPQQYLSPSIRDKRKEPSQFTDAKLPYGFYMNDYGLHYQGEEENGEVVKPIHIASYFEVIGETINKQGNETSILIRFKNRDIVRQEMVGKSELHDTSNEFIKRLASNGLNIETGKAHQLLKQFFNRVKAPYLIHTNKSGWHGNSFLLNDGSEFNPPGIAAPVIMNPSHTGRSSGQYGTNGSLDGWQSTVAVLAAGNPPLAFQMCATLAGPLLELMHVQGGGFHFHGNSRSGKSTALKMAGSVFGRPDASGQIRSWRTTDNALEAVAEQMNDQCLLLDEISQVDNARTVGHAAYMLANGSGKGRSNQSGNAREIKTFRVLFLSNGERTLDNMMDAENAGKIKNEGIGVRMADVPMAELSMHSDAHGFRDMKALMDEIPSLISENHGWAGKEFLAHIVAMRSDDEYGLKECVRGLMDQFKNSALQVGSDPQIASVCERFALVAAAGELAIEMGILPWDGGESSRMALICFKACIEARAAGIGGGEEYKAIELIREYMQVHEAKFQEDVSYVPPIKHGHRDDRFFYFNATGFKTACAGMDTKFVAKVLHEHGYLKKSAGERNYNAKVNKTWAAGERFYHVYKSILSDQ